MDSHEKNKGPYEIGQEIGEEKGEEAAEKHHEWDWHLGCWFGINGCMSSSLVCSAVDVDLGW